MTTSDLDEFTTAYLEAILFGEMDESDENGGYPLDRNYTIEDFAPSAIARTKADCDRFRELAADDLAEAERLYETGEWSPQGRLTSVDDQAGYDLYMTRVGHGVGFWEPGDWPDGIGDRLDAIAKSMGEIYTYVGDDGLIYTD